MKIQTHAFRGDCFGLMMILTSAMLWGTVGVFAQGLHALSATNAVSIGFFRLAISVPVLFLACVRTLGWQTFQISRRDLVLMAFTGAMAAFYQVSYFASVELIGVAAATLITLCTAPIWVALLASLLLRERFTVGLFGAALCAILGTGLLVNLEPGQIALQSQTILGVGFALSSAAGYAAIVLCSRSLSKRCHPLQSLTVSFFTGAVLLLPVTLIGGLVLQYSLTGWLILLYLGIVPTALAYLLYFSGMRHTTATVASIATLLEPLTSTVLAWWLLDEQLSPWGWAGGILLLTAIGILYWESLSRQPLRRR